MSGTTKKDWFDSQKEIGLIDFKCAVSSPSSSYSIACEDLLHIQAVVAANLCAAPSQDLRPDHHHIAELRQRMAADL